MASADISASLRTIELHRVLMRGKALSGDIAASRGAVLKAVRAHVSVPPVTPFDRTEAGQIMDAVLSTRDAGLIPALADEETGVGLRQLDQALLPALRSRVSQRRFLAPDAITAIRANLGPATPSLGLSLPLAQHALATGDQETLIPLLEMIRRDLGSSTVRTLAWVQAICQILDACHTNCAPIAADTLIRARRSSIFRGAYQSSFQPTAHHLMVLRALEVPIDERVASKAYESDNPRIKALLTPSAHGALLRSQLPDLSLAEILAFSPAELDARISQDLAADRQELRS